jgi:protein-S-isoprenylcysteine O-methyltransferase Ste14
MRSSSSSPDAAPEPTVAGRGAGWVATQFGLMAAIIAAGFFPPEWPAGARTVLTGTGAVLAAAGIAFAVWAARSLGSSLTPFPKPLGTGLVTSGPFAIVRHPIYLGGLAFFAGYALFASVPALILTAVLGLLWVGKMRVEERLLTAAYDGYAAYCVQVRRRLIPFVY